jgi:hypothetical protein
MQPIPRHLFCAGPFINLTIDWNQQDKEESMLSQQMATRLSQKLGLAVLISCSLAGEPAATTFQGINHGMVHPHAAAFYKKKIL